MSVLKKVALALVCGAVSSPVAMAQAAPSSTGQMHLNVVVTNGERGTPIPDLSRSVFSVLDNGKPAPIDSFRAVDGQPVKVIIVLDDVNIDYSRLAYARQQLDGFLKANGGKLPEPTALALVTDTNTELVPNFTEDGNQLSQVLDSKSIGLRDLRRSSGFYGAQERLDISLRALNGLLTHAETIPGRKLIVWISPGWPLLSGPGVQLTGGQAESIFREIQGFSAEMIKANTTLYAVDPLGAGQSPLSTYYYEEYLKGVGKPSQVSLGNLSLQVQAIRSGGLALAGSNAVGSLIERCYEDARAFYELTFTPAPGEPGQYHDVQVRIAEPNLKAHALEGYYTQP